MKIQQQLLGLGVFFLALLVCHAAADCSVSVKQTLGSAWKQDGKDLSQWNVQLTAGSETVTSLELAVTGGTLDQLWELARLPSSGLFVLPDYRIQSGGLAAGQTHQFGYIIESASAASITVSSISCGTVASPAPSAAASPSASPAASPAASPSSSPAASPSSSAKPSLVATPQPSSAPGGCSISVTQTARAASAGGSWVDGASQFQIFDVVIANNGQQPVTGAQLTIALADGQSITQVWNVQLLSGSTYIIPNTFGPLQVGASLGAGYVLRSPVAGGQPATPAVAINSVSCSGAAASASPTPSAAAASPSRSPAPSNVVATPQPSPAGCSGSVSVVARAASAGGMWQQGGSTFQIFDITLINNGQRPINGGVMSFAFAEASASITQFWELNRQGTTNIFNVAFNFGALQVGANLGSGIVVQVTGSAPAATPSVTLSSLSCQ